MTATATINHEDVERVKRWLYWPSVAVMLVLISVFGAQARERQDTIDRMTTKMAQDAVRLQAILDSTPFVMVSCDRDHKIVMANRASEYLFGYRSDELIGQDVEILMPQNIRDQHINATLRAEARINSIPGNWSISPDKFQGEALNRRGQLVPVTISVSTIKYGVTPDNPKGTVEFVARLEKVGAPLPEVRKIQPPPPEAEKLIDPKRKP